MSDTGSQHALVPIVPQGQLELASTTGPGTGQSIQGAQVLTYEQLLRFYVEQA